jgi:hypothetical protein
MSVILGGKETQAATSSVTNQESVTVNFATPFSTPPKVVVTLRSDVGSIECFLSDVTTAGFQANFSNFFTGDVHYIAIEE